MKGRWTPGRARRPPPRVHARLRRQAGGAPGRREGPSTDRQMTEVGKPERIRRRGHGRPAAASVQVCGQAARTPRPQRRLKRLWKRIPMSKRGSRPRYGAPSSPALRPPCPSCPPEGPSKRSNRARALKIPQWRQREWPSRPIGPKAIFAAIWRAGAEAASNWTCDLPRGFALARG